MSTLTQDMKNMIAEQQCFIATVSKAGSPNVAPKRSTRVVDDETLAFNEGTGGATYQNMLDGSKVVVAVVNRDVIDGFRFLCDVNLRTASDPQYEAAKEKSLKMGLPAPRALALLHINEIQSRKPGPTAGKKIG